MSPTTINTPEIAAEIIAAGQRHKEGRLSVRARIGQLLDPGAPFLELSLFAGHNLYADPSPAGGIITGIGKIHGEFVMIIANDSSTKGGSYFPITVKKHLRAQEIAEQNKLPCIMLVDSGGANLEMQENIFPDRDHFGRIFYNQARMSAQSIPQLAVVLGSCTAGGAYIPAMADQSIMVRNQATVFLAGPPLVQAATGEVVTAEALGGAELHGRESGLTDFIAESDTHALAIARDLARHFPPRHAQFPRRHTNDVAPRQANCDIEALLPKSARAVIPMLDVLQAIADPGSVSVFKPEYGETLLTAFAELGGFPIGVVANLGVLFGESAQKGAHFIQLCDRRGIPLLFIQDITGFMVGAQYERTGIAKSGAMLVNAVACARVPKITLIAGKSYGAGNYGMCGRAYSPNFLFSWPESRTAVMGGEQAATVLEQLRARKQKPGGSAASHAELVAEYETKSAAIYGSARLWDDGIIQPNATRATLITARQILAGSTPLGHDHAGYGIFRF